MAAPLTKTIITELPPKRTRSRWGLAIVDHATSWAHLTPGDINRVLSCGIRWVDARLRSPNSNKILAAARAYGLETRGHDWDGTAAPGREVSVANATTGRTDGYKAAVRAIAAGVDVYSANFEWAVWRGEKAGKANPHADEYMEAFFEAFDERARGITLSKRYLGFSDPTLFYGTSDLDLDGHPDNTIPGFLLDGKVVDGATAMVYQGDRMSIRKTIDRARKVWGGKLTGAYTAPGRVDGHGNVIGCEAAWVEIAKGGEVGEISIYFGFTDPSNRVQPWEMICKGHAKHRAWVDIIAECVGPSLV